MLTLAVPLTILLLLTLNSDHTPNCNHDQNPDSLTGTLLSLYWMPRALPGGHRVSKQSLEQSQVRIGCTMTLTLVIIALNLPPFLSITINQKEL